MCGGWHENTRRKITLKRWTKLLMRSVDESDAEAMLEYIRRTAEETYFLIVIREEVRLDLEERRRYYERVWSRIKQFGLQYLMEIRWLAIARFRDK